MSSLEQTSGDPLERLLISAGELAAMLQVSRRTLWRMKSAGHLPAPLRLGGNVRWRMRDVISWIDQGCPTQTSRENESRRR